MELKKKFKFALWLLMAAFLIVITIGAVLWYFWSSNLPYIGSLKDYNPPIITEIFSSDGQVIGKFYDEKRIIINLDQVSKDLLNAIIASEDDRFYEHEGIDFAGILRAFLKNLISTRIKGGGSTITQQVTRAVLLKDTTKTYKRKAREAMLSLQIEKMFSKERILFLYINQIYLGHGAYGVEAAGQTYFGKSAKDLNLAECALIAGLPQAPSKYDPVSHFEKAKERQKYVLQRMVEERYITEAQRNEALETHLVIGEKADGIINNSQYFAEYIRRYIEKQYGRDVLYRGGLKVYTTMDTRMQESAVNALNKGLAELDKREGYRKAIKALAPDEVKAFEKETAEKLLQNPPAVGSVVQGFVTDVNNEDMTVTVNIGGSYGLLPLSEMNWARRPNPDVNYFNAVVQRPGAVLKNRDVILCRIKEESQVPGFNWVVSLEQEPEIQGAVFAMDIKSGKVRAMVGGRDFSLSQFDRATQAKRQTGSAFKPIIYAAALDYGMTPSTVILDTAYISSMNPEDDDVWRPKNYDGDFLGPTLFRNALITSKNVITIKILKEIGVKSAIDYARRLGITADLAPELSLALGSSAMTLKEITTAYSAFANGGSLVEPYFIERIEDRRGLVLEEYQPVVREVIPEDTAYVMTNILEGVINEGTGRRSRELGRPVAGKTGTTNDLKDAWFIGYSPRLLAGVWVGYDDSKPMSRGETGARAANPIWDYFMAEALKDQPVEAFYAPDSVTFVKIDSESGLLPSAYSKETVFQAFKKGTEPTEYTPKPESAKSGQFQQFDMDFDK
jgi:penicillin-binding protein 1A